MQHAVPLAEAFPDMSSKQIRKKKRRRRRAEKKALNSFAGYYNRLVNVRPPDSDSSDEEMNARNYNSIANTEFFSFPYQSDSDESSDSECEGPTRVRLTQGQCMTDKRLREAGFVPNPNSVRAPRTPWSYSQPGYRTGDPNPMNSHNQPLSISGPPGNYAPDDDGFVEGGGIAPTPVGPHNGPSNGGGGRPLGPGGTQPLGPGGTPPMGSGGTPPMGSGGGGLLGGGGAGEEHSGASPTVPPHTHTHGHPLNPNLHIVDPSKPHHLATQEDQFGQPAGHRTTQNWQEYNVPTGAVQQYPPLSTKVPYGSLDPAQSSRMAVANQGYRLNVNQASTRQNTISEGALGGGRSSSAQEVAFSNLSNLASDSNVDSYEAGGGVGIGGTPVNPWNSGFKEAETMSLYDFSQDAIYPYAGYTDYETTYKNPLTGEVTQTYTLDLERYKTNTFKEIPTYELGKPNRRFEAMSGLDRLQRPLPQKTEQPNDMIMPTFDPTYGFADAEASRRDGTERASRTTFLTRDPGIMPLVDQGHWTGYYGTRNMARYGNSNVYSKKAAPYGSDAATYDVPASDQNASMYRIGEMAPGFYVSGNPQSYIGTYHPGHAELGKEPTLPQADPSMPQADTNIPMPRLAVASHETPYVQAGMARMPRADSAMVASQRPGETQMDQRVAQDTQGARPNIPMSILSIPGYAAPETNVANRTQGGSGAFYAGQASEGTSRTGGADSDFVIPTQTTPSLNLHGDQSANPFARITGDTGIDPGPQAGGDSSVNFGSLVVNPMRPGDTNQEMRIEGQGPGRVSWSNPIVSLGSLVGSQNDLRMEGQGTGRLPSGMTSFIPSIRGSTEVSEGIRDTQDSGIPLNQVGPNTRMVGTTDVSNQMTGQGSARTGMVMPNPQSRVVGTTEVSNQMTGQGPARVGIANPGAPNSREVPLNQDVGYQTTATDPLPGDFSRSYGDIRHVPSATDIPGAFELTVPDSGQMNYKLRDGSHTLNARLNAESFLQNHWDTDTAKARQFQIAAPKNELIYGSNPRTEAAPVMQLQGAQMAMPAMPNQASQAVTRMRANMLFKGATPINAEASDTEYETDCASRV